MEIGKFKKLYKNLPEKEKENVIVIINDKKITWKKALEEIEKNTLLGKKIGKKLVELGVV